MTETIEQLIDDVIGKTIMFHGNKFYESKLPGMYARYREEMDYARSALLARITQIQQEAERLAYNEHNNILLIENIYDALGLEDYTQSCIPRIENIILERDGLIDDNITLKEALEEAQRESFKRKQESDEWRKLADKLAEKLFDYAEEDNVSGSFGSGCMSNPDVYIADVKNEYRALVLHYPHADEKGIEVEE